MLKATDLRERTLEDLKELEKTLSRDVFQNRFKNFTNRLDDTSAIRKAKKDLARVKTILTERVRGLTPVAAPAAEPTTSEDAPKAKAKAAPKAKKEAAPKAAAAPKAETKAPEAAPSKPKAEKKTAAKKTSKKGEAE